MIDWMMVIKVGLAVAGGLIVIKWKKNGLILVIAIGLITWLLMRARYTVVEGETLVGILVDNFRFVGINLKQGWVNADLSNVIAQSMLKLKLW